MIEVQQDHDVAAVLDQALGLLDHHFGDLDVTHRRLVEGRGNDLALHRALHVRDFLGPLVDQEHDQVALGMIGRDRVRDVLHQHGLAGAWRRHDQGALALADRRHDVDNPCRKVFSGGVFEFEPEALIGKQRRQIVEIDLVLGFFRVLEIQRVDLQQREIAFAFFRTADVALDGVAGAKPEAADLRGRDVDVVRSRQIVRVRRTQKSETVGENLDDAFADNVGFLDRELLEDSEHQLLLAHGAGVFDPFFFRKRDKFGWRLGFEVLKFHFPHWEGPVE